MDKWFRTLWEKWQWSPRQAFIRVLRRRVLRRFAEQIAPALGANLLDPSIKFTTHLRAKILTAFTDQQAREAGVEKIRIRVRPQRRFVFPLKSLKYAMAGALALMVFIPSVFFPGASNQQTIAAGTTRITAVSGEVWLSRDDWSSIATNQASISTDMTLETLNGTATVQFFDDSVIRLAPNTRIVFDTLAPHNVRDDIGKIRIFVQQGHVWAKSFAFEQTVSQVALVTNKGFIDLAPHAALDLEVSRYQTVVRVFDRSATLSLPYASEGPTAIGLAPGEIAAIGLNNDFSTSSIEPEEYASYWVRQNETTDERLIVAYAAQKLASTEEEVTQLLRAMQASDDITDVQMIQTQDAFVQYAQALLTNATDAQQLGDEFAQNLRSLHAHDASAAKVILASQAKLTSGVLPNQPLFAAKRLLEQLSGELNPETTSQQQHVANRIWEAKRLAQQGEIELAEEVVEQLANTDALATESSAASLVAAKEQIATLEQVAQTEGIDSEEIEDAAEATLERAIVIAHQNKVARETRYQNASTAKTIANKLDIYNDFNGKRNTLVAELRKLENSSENLDLIKRLRNQVGDDFASVLNQKILTILEAERKAKLQ